MQGQLPVVAMSEVGQMLGVSRGRVQTLVSRPDFPAPIAALTVGRVWSSDDVRAWAERTGRVVHPVGGR